MNIFRSKYFQVLHTFEQGERFCHSIGGELLGIANGFENNEVRSGFLDVFKKTEILVLIAHSGQFGAWLGLQKKNGTFHWVNGESSPYRHWIDSHEPKQNCVGIARVGTWQGEFCKDTTLPVICQEYL